MKVGFIGLGNMGAPMAQNLARAGHEVVGYDLIAPCPEGIAATGSAADAARGRDVVITMLPNGDILRAVAAEIIPEMDAGAAFLDCSTVDVDSARAVAADAEAAGLLALDAPVSGGVGGAAGGTLTFMAGGTEAGFAKVAPLFEGSKGGALRPIRQRSGRQDLQQHDPGRHHDRHLRGVRAGRQAGAGPAENVRRGLYLIGL